jgi:hypothetical protein
MQQVLETPEIQDTEFTTIEDSQIPSHKRGAAATEKTHQPISLLRSVVSVFTGSRPEYIPEEYVAIVERQESSIDHLCRTDPYLCIRTLSV